LIRVLQILPNFGPAGAEQMAVNLMRTLNREQFEVSAISFFDPSGSDQERILAQEGIHVWHLGKRSGFDPRMFVRVARVLNYFRPHVVHTHRYVLRYALPSMVAGQVLAMIHTVHNLAEKEVDWSGRLIHRIAFKQGVVPVAIAREVDDSLRRFYKIDGSPLILNGIPVSAFRNPSIDSGTWRKRESFTTTDVLYVCVARLRPQKNPALLLKAFARSPGLDPRAHLLLVGHGELRRELERQIDALGQRGRIHLLGVRSDIPEVLNAADVFVLSSDWEGNPLSVMEAMASGTPVISTAIGGVPELVEDGESGILVPRGDAQALAGAMQYMLENPEVRISMGKASARRAVEHFDVQAMTEAYEQLYRTVIAARRSLSEDGQTLRQDACG
jgi:glycosyltransferase involved in cell wall biosynthesis